MARTLRRLPRVLRGESRRASGTAIVTACNYPASEGLKVLTRSERTLSVRKLVLEMMLARCSEVPVVRELAHEYGIEKSRFGDEKDTCIHCGLCVRMCDEIVGAHALCFRGERH
jgi:NADH dehydrogenase/NADH:ubiquinone oxidoreductase subunit G